MNIEQAVWQALDHKTKPQRSLGRLEELAAQMALIQQTLEPVAEHARMLVFGADHGIAAEGVSAYPQAVTAEMMRNFDRGGAAVSVLARTAGVATEIIDVGVAADLRSLSSIIHAKVRPGTRNMLYAPAMSEQECQAAMQVGRAAVQRAAAAGVTIIGLGEMGIGNTTAAATLLSALTGAAPAATVGRGTGIDADQVAHKCSIVEQVLARHSAAHAEPLQALATFGGLELAALAGAALEAPEHRMAVVVDGFIVTVAILAAVQINPAIRPYLVFAHRSTEHGHQCALDALDARPLLELDMRLGEGSGAVLAIPLMRAAVAILRNMATFESAGVSRSEREHLQ